MKKWLVLPVCLFAGWMMAQDTRPDWVEKAQYLRFDEETNVPAFIRFKPGNEIPATNLDGFLRNFLSMGAQDEYREIRSEHDQIGYVHRRMQQYHNGYPVEFGIFISHEKAGKVVSVNGDHFPITPQNGLLMTQEAALASAMAFVGAEEYIWELPGMDEELQAITGNPNATYRPTGMVVYAPTSFKFDPATYRLAYKFDIYSTRPLNRTDIYVDAENGQVILSSGRMFAADSAGVAQTMYSGTQNIIADFTGTNFRLKEVGRGGGIWTRDMNNQTNFSLAVDFIDADNDWNNTTNNDHAAGDTHWAAEMTYDYLQSVHGMNSINNNGMNLLMYVHYDQNWFNARWDGQRAMFGDGPGNNSPFGTIDIAAHELGHGVTGNSANLVYQDESGALNESFSDIIGAMVEYHYGINPDWLIGEDRGGPLRSMSNPGQYQNPDTYHGTYWEFTSFDNGGVHINSGVQNFWFYLLSLGGTGTNDNGDAYSVTAISRDSAELIAMRNLRSYLTPSSQFSDARFYSIQSAIDLFGECSQQMISVVDAWYAVGVGTAWGPLATDFMADEIEFCNGPATVQFTNLSQGALSYFWDFGDFSFSGAENPSHTYNFLGTYSPRLVATGCAAEKDTLQKQNYITLNTGLPCSYNMPSSGSGGTYASCNGKLRDSGGLSNYLSSVNATVTIAPTGADQVELNFTQFEFAAAGDYIRIYDGPNASSPQIGIYAGTTLPGGGTITSTGPSITIQEVTNAINEYAGFVLEWSCLVNTDEGKLGQLDVYPNPAQESFRISYTRTDLGNATYVVTDALGKHIVNGKLEGGQVKAAEVNTAQWTAGVYFLRLLDGDRALTRKVMVQ